jgi:hypothetical protein
MEANIREKKLLVLYSELKNNWEKEIYIEACIHDARRGIGCWKNWHLEVKDY